MAAAKPSQKVETTTKGEEIDDVVAVITLASRALSKLGQSPALQNGVGLTEWALLHALAGGGTHRAGQIAWQMGITPQRTAQVVSGLSEAGYIGVASVEEDSRKKDLTLLAQGKQKMKAVDAEILEIFRKAFKDRPQALPGMKRGLRSLLNTLSPPAKAATESV